MYLSSLLIIATLTAFSQQFASQVQLTAEERKAVDNALALYKGYAAPADKADRVVLVAGCNALNNYSIAEVGRGIEAGGVGNPNGQIHIEKAKAALKKAYDICLIPTYLFDLAGLCELNGEPQLALDLYKRFVAEQSAFKPDDIVRAVLKNRDPASEIETAKQKVKALESAIKR